MRHDTHHRRNPRTGLWACRDRRIHHHDRPPVIRIIWEAIKFLAFIAAILVIDAAIAYSIIKWRK